MTRRHHRLGDVDAMATVQSAKLLQRLRKLQRTRGVRGEILKIGDPIGVQSNVAKVHGIGRKRDLVGHELIAVPRNRSPAEVKRVSFAIGDYFYHVGIEELVVVGHSLA